MSIDVSLAQITEALVPTSTLQNDLRNHNGQYGLHFFEAMSIDVNDDCGPQTGRQCQVCLDVCRDHDFGQSGSRVAGQWKTSFLTPRK